MNGSAVASDEHAFYVSNIMIDSGVCPPPHKTEIFDLRFRFQSHLCLLEYSVTFEKVLTTYFDFKYEHFCWIAYAVVQKRVHTRRARLPRTCALKK